MTDYSAHDIHRLDQAYPDALADLETFTGDPKQKAALAAKGTEVYAAELTRELADTATSPMSLAAWAAIATVQLMEAGRVWEEDTDAAWAKVAELTAELAKGRDAVVAMTQTALDHRTTTSNALNRATRLYEQLAAAQNALRSLGQAYADLKTDNDELAAENARVRQQRDGQAKAAAEAAKKLDNLRDYIVNAIPGDGLDAAELMDIATDLATVLGDLGHPVADEDEAPRRPVVTVELPAEATR